MPAWVAGGFAFHAAMIGVVSAVCVIAGPLSGGGWRKAPDAANDPSLDSSGYCSGNAVVEGMRALLNTNPYRPPASSDNSSQAKPRARRSRLQSLVGLVSVVAFFYLSWFQVLLIVFGARGCLLEMDAVVSYPPVMAIHVFVCTVGGTTGMYLLVHVFRNRQIRLSRKILWGVVIAAGYGMVFYWYRYVRLS